MSSKTRITVGALSILGAFGVARMVNSIEPYPTYSSDRAEDTADTAGDTGLDTAEPDRVVSEQSEVHSKVSETVEEVESVEDKQQRIEADFTRLAPQMQQYFKSLEYDFRIETGSRGTHLLMDFEGEIVAISVPNLMDIDFFQEYNFCLEYIQLDSEGNPIKTNRREFFKSNDLKDILGQIDDMLPREDE